MSNAVGAHNPNRTTSASPSSPAPSAPAAEAAGSTAQPETRPERDEVNLSPEAQQEEETGGLPVLEAAYQEESTEETATEGTTAAETGAPEATTEETPTDSPDLATRAETIQGLMSQADWSQGGEQAQETAAAVAEQLEGLPLEERIQVLEEHGALQGLSEFMGSREEGDFETGGYLDAVEPFAGMLTPGQVDQLGGIVRDSVDPFSTMGQAYSVLDRVREENPDPLAQREAGRAAFGEIGDHRNSAVSDILSGSVDGFDREQLVDLAEASDDPELQSRFAIGLEHKVGPYEAERLLEGHDIRGERSVAEQIDSQVSEVREHEWEERRLDTPDGGSVLERTHERDGTSFSQLETRTEDGELAERRTEIVEPATGDLDNVEGLGLFQNLGLHDNPQGLLNDLEEAGTPTVEDRRLMVEARGEDGEFETSTRETRTWEWEDEETTLTRLDDGEGRALQWELTRPMEGDGVATQRFIQGSTDTSIQERFTDEQGFQVERLVEERSDLAAQVAEDGEEPIPSDVEQTVAFREDASVSDLEHFLSEEDLTELRENEDFQHMLDSFGEDSLAMGYRQTSIGYDQGENADSPEYHERLTMEADGRLGVLTRSDETGRWSFAFADEEGERGRAIGENGGTLEFNPYELLERRPNGDITQIRSDARAIEAGVGSVQRGTRAGARLALRLSDGVSGLARVGNSVDSATSSDLFNRYAQSMDVLGAAVNGVAAAQQALGGDIEGALGSSAGAATDLGGLAANRTGHGAGLVRRLGYLGAAYTGGTGLYQISQGEYVRGGLNTASGLGAALAISGAAPGAGWALSGVASVGLVTYDYIDRTSIAELAI